MDKVVFLVCTVLFVWLLGSIKKRLLKYVFTGKGLLERNKHKY